jgi:para-aminobenzoate synthetase component 1
MFNAVMDGLRRGDSYLVNLTVATPIECSLSLSEIFAASSSPYQLLAPGRFVCFSPERFVLIKEGRISTCPMKGTINADVPGAEAAILADFKETAEHDTVVDLLRNDLSLSASEVRVSRYRYVDRIRTRQREILQVSSEITGSLPGDYRDYLGDIVFRALPAGSCSGAPKESTVNIIRRAERSPRGFYTGVFGVFDGEGLDSAVMIRFIEQSQGGLFFRSGGGITAYSTLELEYQEVLEKIYLPFA